MPRLVFLNRFFFPDHSATSQLLGDLAFHLSAAGAEVHVITSRQLYDEPRAGLPPVDKIGGVHIHRVATTRFGRTGLLGRTFDYLSYGASMCRSVLALLDHGDILIAKTDPPLTSIFALALARMRRVHLINWLQDIYPETAIALGVRGLNGPPGAILSRLRDISLKHAAANVVVGEGMARRLRLRGVPSALVRVIPNWINDEEIFPVPPTENPLRREWGLDRHFVVGYSGNLGRAHEIDTVLSAAERLRNRRDLMFLFIGGGYLFDELARLVQSRGLGGLFRFLPYQRTEDLRYSLGVPDVHLICLRAELEGLVVPSKVYGIAAAGRPVIAITAEFGEIAQLVREHGCGMVIAPGDGDALAKALLRLADQPALAIEMGRRARRMLDSRFSRKTALTCWEELLGSVANPSDASLGGSKRQPLSLRGS